MAREDFHDLAKRVTVRVDGADHSLMPDDLIVKPVPYTGGGLSVVTDINGKRVSTFADEKFHLDIELKWKELGPFHYPSFCTMVDDIIDNVGTAATFYFCSKNPYDASYAIQVIPEMGEEMIKMIYSGRLRNRAASITLKGEDYVTEIPSWLKF